MVFIKGELLMTLQKNVSWTIN